jgi:hypothetical protein
LGDLTHASLLDWITGDQDVSTSSISNVDYVLSNMVATFETRPQTLSFNVEWTKSIFAAGNNYFGKLLRNPLAIGTVLRLLRFLNHDRKDQWLSVFLNLTKSSRKCVSTLASLPEWQPCMFHLISECLDLVHIDDLSSGNEMKCSINLTDEVGGSTLEAPLLSQKRLDLCLQLYATLLGHLFRSGGDKVCLIAFVP